MRLLAGGAPSVWRAVSVTVTCPAGGFWRMKVRLDDALAISAIVFILYQPFVLFQPGFQLSYMAAFSLVYSSSITSKSESRTYRTIFSMSHRSVNSRFIRFYLFIFMSYLYRRFLSIFFMFRLYSLIILPANIVLLFADMIYLPELLIVLFYCMVHFEN